MTERDSLLAGTVADLLAAVAAKQPAPGGGAVAALAGSLAAGLAAMAARFTETEPASVSAADDLLARLRPLADADAEAYGGFLTALRMPKEPDPTPRRDALRRARNTAADVPHAVATAAAEVAELGNHLVRNGNRNLRGDAAAAAQLAAAAASTAAILVAENLAKTPDDPRIADAARRAEAARAAATSAIDEFPLLNGGAG